MLRSDMIFQKGQGRTIALYRATAGTSLLFVEFGLRSVWKPREQISRTFDILFHPVLH